MKKSGEMNSIQSEGLGGSSGWAAGGRRELATGGGIIILGSQCCKKWHHVSSLGLGWILPYTDVVCGTG